MIKNTASQIVAFQMISSTDGSAVTTGTPTVYVTGDGGSQGAGSGSAVHEGVGCWSYAPTQAETNYNHVAFTMVLSGAISQTVNVYPVVLADYKADISALATQASVDTIDGIVDTIVSRVVGTIAAGTHNAQTGDTYALANGANGFANIKSDTAGIKAKTDSLTFTVAGDVDVNVQSWKGSAAADMTGDAYARLGAPAGASVSADVAAVKSDTAATLIDTNELQTDITNGGRVDLLIDGIHAKTTNLPAAPAAVGSQMDLVNAPNATAVTAIQNGLATPTNITAGTITTVTNLTNAPTNGDLTATMKASVNAEVDAALADAALTAGGIADAVWDELTADHAGVGSTGAAVAAAGGSGDPWATALPGSYGAGTAGKLIGDNINAPIATVDTVVDAIKAKTDNLPTDPADQSAVEAAITSAHSTTNGLLNTIAGYLDTEIAAILEDTGITIPGLIAALNNPSVASIADAVMDEVLTDLTDNSLNAGQDITPRKALRAIFNRFFREVTQTATTQIVKNDLNAQIAEMAVSDDGTTQTKGIAT